MKTKPIICSGINRWQDAKALVNAGASELYFGVDMPEQMYTVRSYGLTARGAPNHNLNGLDELKRLCDATHELDAKLTLLMNMYYSDDQLAKAMELSHHAYSAGIRRFIVSDLGLAAQLVENFSGITLHASSIMGISTRAAAANLKQKGFSRIIVPRYFPLGFLSCIEAEDLETEVLFYRERCYFDDGHCYFSHGTGKRFLGAFSKKINRGISHLQGVILSSMTPRYQETLFHYLPPENGCMQNFDALDTESEIALGALRRHRNHWACGACSLPLMFSRAKPFLKVVNRTQTPRRVLASVRFVKEVLDLYGDIGKEAGKYCAECRELFSRTHAIHDCGRYCYYPEQSKGALQNREKDQNFLDLRLRTDQKQEGEKNGGRHQTLKRSSSVGIDWRRSWPEWLKEGGGGGIWIGSETCVNALPPVSKIKDLCERSASIGMTTSLLLPCFTEESETQVKAIVDAFALYGGNEIIVNDFNGVNLITPMFPVVSIGRLAFPFDIDPRLLNEKSGRFGKHGFNKKTLIVLSKYDIFRAYLQPVFPLPTALFADSGMEVGIICKWMYLTQTYFCPWVDAKCESSKSAACAQNVSAPCTHLTPCHFSDSKKHRYVYLNNAIYYESPFPLTLFEQDNDVRSIVHWPPIETEVLRTGAKRK